VLGEARAVRRGILHALKHLHPFVGSVLLLFEIHVNVYKHAVTTVLPIKNLPIGVVKTIYKFTVLTRGFRF
jgi:hypothetical protein